MITATSNRAAGSGTRRDRRVGRPVSIITTVVAAAFVLGPGPAVAAPAPAALSAVQSETVTPAVPLGVTVAADLPIGADQGVATSAPSTTEAGAPVADGGSSPLTGRGAAVTQQSARPAERVDAPVEARTIRPAVRLTTPAPEPVLQPLARPIVVLYGDSLAWEARHTFVEAFADRPDVDVVVHTFGGTAICDWLDQMARDAATLRPGAVVVEFSGNNFTPCMQDGAGAGLTGAAYLDRYRADAATVIATFAPIGAQVLFAGGPLTRAAAERGDGQALNAMYARLAGAHDAVRYVDAGAAVLDDGEWAATLPCLPFEPCTGGTDAAGVPVNVVRAPDGIHFCPAAADAVRGVTGDCPVWSSGAFRYGAALAQPVLDHLAVS